MLAAIPSNTEIGPWNPAQAHEFSEASPSITTTRSWSPTANTLKIRPYRKWSSQLQWTRHESLLPCPLFTLPPFISDCSTLSDVSAVGPKSTKYGCLGSMAERPTIRWSCVWTTRGRSRILSRPSPKSMIGQTTANIRRRSSSWTKIYFNWTNWLP